MGSERGGPGVGCTIQEMPILQNIVVTKCLCPFSISRNTYAEFFYIYLMPSS